VRIFYGPRHREHAPGVEFDGDRCRVAPCPEIPERAEAILAALQRHRLAELQSPRKVSLGELAAVHDPGMLEFLEGFGREVMGPSGEAAGRSEVLADAFALRGGHFGRRPADRLRQFGFYCFDPQTALGAGTWAAALEAAGCALGGAGALLSAAAGDGRAPVYALCRPPGHHAGPDFFGGYCYLNNAALAAARLAAEGAAAVLDLDYHHGNGTQAIFYSSSRVLFVSLHADPQRAYPYFCGYVEERGDGEGLGFNRNWPLPLRCEQGRYLDTLRRALEDIAKFAPRFLVVSLGTDTCQEDPVGGMGLSVEGFGLAAAAVRSLGLPTLVVQEGGYRTAVIGECVAAFLAGLGE
jgi:acetoin utilization deacetylase AcuC-like enzyme